VLFNGGISAAEALPHRMRCEMSVNSIREQIGGHVN
jgi:hypothetical protein